MNQGIVRIEGKFREAPTSTLTCVVYTEYDGSIEIDKDRNTTLHFKQIKNWFDFFKKKKNFISSLNYLKLTHLNVLPPFCVVFPELALVFL